MKLKIVTLDIEKKSLKLRYLFLKLREPVVILCVKCNGSAYENRLQLFLTKYTEFESRALVTV